MVFTQGEHGSGRTLTAIQGKESQREAHHGIDRRHPKLLDTFRNPAVVVVVVEPLLHELGISNPLGAGRSQRGDGIITITCNIGQVGGGVGVQLIYPFILGDVLLLLIQSGRVEFLIEASLGRDQRWVDYGASQLVLTNTRPQSIGTVGGACVLGQVGVTEILDLFWAVLFP